MIKGIYICRYVYDQILYKVMCDQRCRSIYKSFMKALHRQRCIWHMHGREAGGRGGARGGIRDDSTTVFGDCKKGTDLSLHEGL